MQSTDAIRPNYSIHMNLDNYLHAHIHPRYDWEPEEYNRGPVSKYSEMFSDQYEYDENEHGDMRKKITENLIKLMKQEGY